jgi:hypothetical protein
VLLLAPSSCYLVYYILDKKYKIILWVAGIYWVATAYALTGIAMGEAFTNNFNYYSFGIYPVASHYLKPWGIISTLGYLLVGLPSYYQYIKQNSFFDRLYLIVGLNLLFILLISNLPSFMGFPVFPGSMFSFIPMCILAYGVFNSEFKNIKDLLFAKSGIFYFLNILVSIVLFALTVVILFTFSPTDYNKINWYPWLFIPLLSIFLVVGLGIFIGGTNPNRQINQLGSFSLYIYGFQLLAGTNCRT